MAAGTAHEPESSILDTIEAVGSYGVNILWVGGCRHGIYTWDYLYALGAGHTPTADHHRAW